MKEKADGVEMATGSTPMFLPYESLLGYLLVPVQNIPEWPVTIPKIVYITEVARYHSKRYQPKKMQGPEGTVFKLGGIFYVVPGISFFRGTDFGGSWYCEIWRYFFSQ